MGKYTVFDVDKKLEENYFSPIKEVIVRELNPISIILFGGFGKGEGSMRDGELFNDIDIYVIVKKRVPDKILEKVGIKASNAINKGGLDIMATKQGDIYDANKHFHVDIRAIKYSKLHKLKKTTRTYELKYGSQTIYGKDILNEIKISEKDLPISEGFRHMINKSAIMLLGMDSRRFNGNFKKDERDIAIYFSTKAIMACGETLLLLKKRFAPTYQEKNKLFKKIYGDELPWLVKKVDFATKLKLDFKPNKIKDPVKYWLEARDILAFTLKYITEKKFAIKIKDNLHLMKILYKKLPSVYFGPYIPLGKITFPLQYILNIKYFLKTRHIRSLLTWRDIGIRILIPAFLLLFAIEDKNLLKNVEYYIKNIAPIKNKTFDGLRSSLLYAYGAYYSQKLI